jgi:hypothetical protein
MRWEGEPVSDFEIGVVYRKAGKLFLAVSAREVITIKNGRTIKIRPHVPYDAVRSISVEELCEAWGIELDEFDRVTNAYLAPVQTGLKTRPRGERRNTQAEEDLWRRVRTGRIARPRL